MYRIKNPIARIIYSIARIIYPVARMKNPIARMISPVARTIYLPARIINRLTRFIFLFESLFLCFLTLVWVHIIPLANERTINQFYGAEKT